MSSPDSGDDLDDLSELNRPYPVVIGLGTKHNSKPCFIYRLKSDPSKCHRFSWLENDKYMSVFRVQCSQCVHAYRNTRRRCKPRIYDDRVRTNGLTMDSDPCSPKHHCKPMDYDDIIKKWPLVSDSLKRRILGGTDITYGKLVMERLASRKRKADSSEEEDSESGIATDGTSCASDSGSSPDEDGVGVDDEEREQPTPPLSSPNPAGNIGSADDKPLLIDKPLVRKIKVLPPKKFERKFDAEDYKEDEVDVSVVVDVLRVKFERKSTSGPCSTSHSLLYAYNLPDYVMVDSISTSWEDSVLVVRAETKRQK